MIDGIGTEEPEAVDPKQAAELVEAGALLVDVREISEWEAGHAPGALHVPLGQLEADTLPRDRVVVTVCRSGARSMQAAQRLNEAGIRVVNLAGGMQAWQATGLAITTDAGEAGSVI